MSHHIIHPHGPHASSMQVEVLLWFAACHDVLWIPIVEVGNEPDAVVEALAKAEAFGRPSVLQGVEDLARIPDGVRGWVFPAHLDDTYTVAQRIGDEVSFGTLRHPVTGEAISYRTDTESAVGFAPPPLAVEPQSAV